LLLRTTIVLLPTATVAATIAILDTTAYRDEARPRRRRKKKNDGLLFEAIMTTPTTAQPAAIQANGTSESPTLDKAQSVAPGKRKRDVDEEDDRDEDMTSDEQKPAITNGEPKKDQRDLIRSFVEVLSRYACFFFLLVATFSPFISQLDHEGLGCSVH
jgi:hypothetical protein